MVGCVAIVAIRTSRVPITVEDETFGGIVRIRSSGEGVTDFCELSVNVRDAGRQIGATGVARKTRLLIRAAKEPCGATGVVWCVTRKAGVLCNGRVAADVCLSDGLVHRGRVNPGGPPGKVIDRARHGAVGIVTGKTKLAVGAVAHEKVLRNRILGLHVWIMARGAFNISQD